MFGIDAEDDGLLESVAAFLEELGDFSRGQLGAVVEHQCAVEILGVVDPILDLLAFSVDRAFFGAVAFDILVDMNLDHLVGRQEAVAYALLQGIGEHRLAEIGDIRDVAGFLRRGGEADLRRRGEIFEDFTPRRVLGRAAAVALVDHDQVEEAGREIAEQLLTVLRPGDCLIKAQIDLVGFVDRPARIDGGGDIGHIAVGLLDGFGVDAEFRHDATERAEVVHHRLVDQHVAVGQKQDAFLAPGLPQTPDDLEGGVGLAGAGGHHQQDAVAALGDGLDRRVDGVDLIVARGFAAAVVVIVLKNDLFGPRVEALPFRIARPQIGR